MPTRPSERISFGFRGNAFVAAISVDDAVAIVLALDSEVGSNEGVARPVKNASRQSVMLGDREPFPVILRSKRQIWKSLLPKQSKNGPLFLYTIAKVKFLIRPIFGISL